MVTSADKGGAILVVTPAQMLELHMSKLSDTERYSPMGNIDPTPVLSNKLHDLWSVGLRARYVSASQARKTVGIRLSKEGYTRSTADIFKPGLTYGYALLKIHKLSSEQIRKKVLPPVRFVTDLSNGLTARTDRFLAWSWIRDLSIEYATDLVRDSTQALQILESFSNNGSVTDDYMAFNFDVVSLYDSLSPRLVSDAFTHAAMKLRPTWDNQFIGWLRDLISLSFEASFVTFKGVF